MRSHTDREVHVLMLLMFFLGSLLSLSLMLFVGSLLHVALVILAGSLLSASLMLLAGLWWRRSRWRRSRK